MQNSEQPKKTLADFIFDRGLRRTIQREAIIQASTSTKEHFTAEDLLEMARKIEPSVSRATVYRTLPLLVESGLLRELPLGGEVKRYDPNFVDHPTHSHLVCTDCGKILEFEDGNLEILENCISHRLGFSPVTKNLTIEAKCDELSARGVCSKRPACADEPAI